MGCSRSLAVNPSLYKKLPYDPVKNFEPISLTLIVPFLLVVNPELPAKNIQELITYLKAHPGKVNFGTAGSGASNHLSMELFMATAGVNMSHIPYKSSPAAVTDLSNRLDFRVLKQPVGLGYSPQQAHRKASSPG